MAEFDVTSPDGKKFRISAPEGASQQQVMDYAKAQFEKMPKEAPAPAEKPGVLATALDLAMKTSPANIVSGAMKKQADATEAAAYKAGGAVTDATGSPGAGYATNVAIQAVPAMIGGPAAKAPVAPMLESAASKLMQSAIKPSFENLANGNAAKAIKTMLEGGISATEGGMAKVQFEVNKLKNEVKRIIATSPATVDKQKVASELFPLLDRVEKQAAGYSPDVAKVEKTFDEFMNHPLLNGDKIPIQLAQDMKKAGNKKLSGDFGELSSAEIEAHKALVRGLKNGIATEEPAVAPLNARMSELLNTLSVANRGAQMAGNKNPLGFAPMTHDPAAAAAHLADRDPWVKSLLARGIYQNSGTAPTAIGTSLGAILGNQSLGQPPRGTLENFQRRNQR